MRFVKKIKKIATIAAVSAACAAAYVSANSYKPMSEDQVQEAHPVNITGMQAPAKYDNMGWQEVIKTIERPEDIVKYQDWLQIKYFQNFDMSHRHTSSFKAVHEGKPYDCTELALGAAAILSDNGYPSYFLAMQDSLLNGHSVFLYKKDGKFRTLYSDKEFDSIGQLVKDQDCSRYLLLNLNDQKNKDWIDGNGDYFSWIGSVQMYIPFLNK